MSPPGMPPFTLNNAVDKLLKREFDHYRELQQPHPLMLQYGVDAIPFAHSNLDTWRSNFKGITYLHEPTNFLLSGAIDDVWINRQEELVVVDYKATVSKEEIITLNTEYRQGYKRQLEIYQFLFRHNGFKVSERAYLVYANGRTDRDSFSNRLEFDLQLVTVDGNTDWIEGALKGAKECLEGELPDHNPDCELCGYVEAVKG